MSLPLRIGSSGVVCAYVCVCVCVCVCARVCLQCVCAVCVAMRFGVPTPARPPEVLHALRAAPCLRASSLPCYPRPPAHSSSLAGLRCAFGPPTSFFFRVTGRSARARVDGWFCLERVATCSELCGWFGGGLRVVLVPLGVLGLVRLLCGPRVRSAAVVFAALSLSPIL